jgi:hypothetical protein
MKIIKERIQTAPRIILYGPEGVGKTTFGASCPNPLFICAERGADSLDVHRVNITTYEEAKEVFRYLVTEKHEYKTLVIDTIDWLEQAIITDFCKTFKKPSIEDFGFGAGYVKLEEETRKFISMLDYICDKGLNIVLLAHSKIERFNDPELKEPIDRWQLKTHKRTSPLYKEWCDDMLFCNHDRSVMDGKAIGGYDRLLWGVHTAARDAKSRHGIGEKIELTWSAIAPNFKQEREQ